MIRINDVPVHTTVFPDNTTQVWKLPEEILKSGSRVVVFWDFCHEGEFLQLAQLKALLDSCAIWADLRIQYLPYARQDKEVSNDTTFALRPFAALLNSLKFDTITCLDPHSPIAEFLIDNCFSLYPIAEMYGALEATESDAICYPDKGAKSKYEALFSSKIHTLYGEKDRDPLTGHINNYSLFGDPKNKRVLIVDDICDGGMTFRLLAAQLLKAGASEVNLFTTHGIFSKGLRCLQEAGISRIFTDRGEVEETGGHAKNLIYRSI